MTFRRSTKDAAKGKWQGILLKLGMPEECLRGKSCPCPMCGGKDRFRFDNKQGAGTYFCNGCGAGDGLALAVKFTGRAFSQVAAEIDALLGNVKMDEFGPSAMTHDDEARARLAAYMASAPIKPGDPAHRYLETRGIEELVYETNTLRFAPAMRDGEGGVRPCMLALVGIYGQPKFANIHRTFLRPDGLAKAEMESPRKMMPGTVPEGACVALSRFVPGPLGIAEGIETAMSASALYGIPVWAALDAGKLAKWWPPEGCDEVAVFGDNDKSFTGQAAAYTLAKRLAAKGIAVNVIIPPSPGEDFNDIWLRRRGKRR